MVKKNGQLIGPDYQLMLIDGGALIVKLKTALLI